MRSENAIRKCDQKMRPQKCDQKMPQLTKCIHKIFTKCIQNVFTKYIQKYSQKCIHCSKLFKSFQVLFPTLLRVSLAAGQAQYHPALLFLPRSIEAQVPARGGGIRIFPRHTGFQYRL